MHWRATTALLAVVLTACGSDTTGDATPTATAGSAATATPTATADVPTTATADVPDSTADATLDATSESTEPPISTGGDVVLGDELVGRWAHYDVVAYEDGTLKTLIISYGFNDFSVVDGRLVDSGEFCFSEQRTDQPIEISLSDAATQAIKPPPTPVEVELVDGVLRLRRPATPTPVGIRLDDPATEALPTDPNDPRIVDDDGDGKPGVTVTIRVSEELTGELYIARREIFAYDVALVEPDLMTGVVIDNSEQLVIAASDPVFESSGGDWEQYSDLTKSPIIMKRVEPDWDCARLAAERDELFPPTPDVDW